jgi:hypothetical protein
MYRFYLTDSLIPGNYFTLDAGGNVIATTTKTPINYIPKGWETMTIQWERHATFYGVFRSLTPKFDFVEDGRKIIEYAYYTAGVEAPIYCIIERQSDQDYSWQSFYSGRIDLETFNDQEFFVSVNIIESGLKDFLDNRSKIVFEFDLQEAPGGPYPPIDLIIDGAIFMESMIWYPIWDQIVMESGGWAIPASQEVARVSDLAICINQGQKEGVFATPLTAIGSKAQAEFSTNYFYQALTKQTVDFTINQQFDIYTNVVASITISLFIIDVNGVVSQNIPLQSYATPAGGGITPVLNKKVSGIVLNKGDKIYLICGTDSSVQITLVVEPNATGSTAFYYQIDVTAQFGNQSVKCYNYYVLFQKLIYEMTIHKYSGYSSFLSDTSKDTYNCYPAFEVVTSGRGLINYQDFYGTKYQHIRTSLDQMFADLQATFGLGLGIENNKIVVESIDHFFNDDGLPPGQSITIIGDLGNVSNLTIEPARDFLFNAVDFGYEQYSYDSNNYYGKNEYFATYSWVFPFNYIDKKLARVSPYRADCMGIEMTRGAVDQKEITDMDTFVIDCDPSVLGPKGERTIYRPPGFTTQFLANGSSWFNFGRSPKRSLFRNSNFLHSFLEFMESNYVQMINENAYNGNVIYHDANGTIAESSQELISTLGPKLFRPIIFKFSAIPPINIAQLMNTNPNGVFTFTWKGIQYRGYPMVVGANLSTYNSFDFTLLCSHSVVINPSKI